MKIPFLSALAALRPMRRQRPDIEAAAPLINLLDEAEPAPDLFARIEERLGDAPRPANRMPLGRIGFVFLCGLLAGGLAVFTLQERQSIFLRTSADGPWLPLGAVTLHGSALRGFMRAECQGYTHFFIAMHGHPPADQSDQTPADVPLTGEEEKIRMECIF